MDEQVFLGRLGDVAGIAAISPAEAEAVLDLARVVAHRVERRFAPLTAYALGLALSAGADPADRQAQVRALISVVEDLAGE